MYTLNQSGKKFKFFIEKLLVVCTCYYPLANPTFFNHCHCFTVYFNYNHINPFPQSY